MKTIEVDVSYTVPQLSLASLTSYYMIPYTELQKTAYSFCIFVIVGSIHCITKLLQILIFRCQLSYRSNPLNRLNQVISISQISPLLSFSREFEVLVQNLLRSFSFTKFLSILSARPRKATVALCPKGEWQYALCISK